MATDTVIPELKQILGAMIFASDQPLALREMKQCLREVAEQERGPYAVFAEAKEADIKAALEALAEALRTARPGFTLMEVGGGYRIQTDASCGVWLKHLLDIGRPQRLSMPALETLAVIAYRQPISKGEIEAVRGVNVDHVIRMLLEMQLIRLAGRSDLPGRPFLYGTTRLFLEHFGLRDLKDLADIEPMLFAAARSRPVARPPAGPAAGDAPSTAVPGEGSGGAPAAEAAAAEAAALEDDDDDDDDEDEEES